MAKNKKIDLYIGIVLLVVMVLNFFGILGMVGITQRFVDIVFLAVAIYLLIRGLK